MPGEPAVMMEHAHNEEILRVRWAVEGQLALLLSPFPVSRCFALLISKALAGLTPLSHSEGIALLEVLLGAITRNECIP
jgi:hypothetical protein